MTRRRFTVWEVMKAFTVDIIRRLWNEGKHVHNKWLKAVHANWFELWVEWKTERIMRDVDRQATNLVELWEAEEDPAIDAYVFSERVEGETPLGGEMRLVASWKSGDE